MFWTNCLYWTRYENVAQALTGDFPKRLGKGCFKTVTVYYAHQYELDPLKG